MSFKSHVHVMSWNAGLCQGLLDTGSTGASLSFTVAHQQPFYGACFSMCRRCGKRSEFLSLGLEQALTSLEQGSIPQPSFEDFAKLLHKSRKEKDGELVLRLHAYMLERGMETHSLLGNYLIPLLVGVRYMHYARDVFHRLSYPNEWSCYCLITGYIKCGNPYLAFMIYDQMHQRGFAYPSGHILVALVKTCTQSRDFARGVELHIEVARLGLLEKNLYVGSTLVALYSKCGMPTIAQEVFDKFSDHDVVLWNALITGYVEQGLGVEALSSFERMQNDGVSPNAITFICVLKACGSIKAATRGQEIHADIERRALHYKNQMIGNALVDMYSKCGSVEIAQHVFDQLPSRDVVTWNSLIAGLAEHGHGEEGLKRFEQMRPRGIFPDPITLVCGLKACSSISAVREGVEIHAEIERLGLLEKDLFLGSTLVDMYARAGLLSRAQQVFNKLSVRGIVAWTALISGYTEMGHAEQALACLDQMQFEGFLPNAVTLVWCLKACKSAGTMGKGEDIHIEIERRGMLQEDLIGNALVDMYAKCGFLAKACQTFDKLLCRDIVSWTALMAGFVQAGESQNAFIFFDKMVGGGVSPNPLTFAVVLSACARIGLYSRGQSFFEAMSDNFGIVSGLEHHNCVVDLLGRAGQIENALAMLKLSPNLVAWQSVLGACRQLGIIKIGKEAFEHAIH